MGIGSFWELIEGVTVPIWELMNELGRGCLDMGQRRNRCCCFEINHFARHLPSLARELITEVQPPTPK